jgi:hypothetical protein
MADCRTTYIKYQAAVNAGNTTGAAAYLNYMCGEGCQNVIYGINCPKTPPPVQPPATPPPDQSCSNYLDSFNSAYARSDMVGQAAAVGAMCRNVPQCPIPSGWSCSGGSAVYNNNNNNIPPVTPPTTPPPSDPCATLIASYNAAKQFSGHPALQAITAQLCASKCQLPLGISCPHPSSGTLCDTYQQQFDTAIANGDTAGATAAVSAMCLQTCKLPSGWTCDNQGAGPVIVPGGTGGSTPSGGGTQTVGPPINPCTGSQSLTLADYLLQLPLKGLQDDPILALVLSAGGGIAALVAATVVIPEASGYVRIPALATGAYGGLIVNGILDNYAWIKNAQKDGIVFGSIVTALGAVSGIYQSIHDSTEKFAKTELGGVAGEIVYKVGEGVISGGLLPVYDAVFGDKTFTKDGYNKAKCQADCGNPKLSSTDRKLCKLGARLDLKF